MTSVATALTNPLAGGRGLEGGVIGATGTIAASDGLLADLIARARSADPTISGGAYRELDLLTGGRAATDAVFRGGQPTVWLAEVTTVPWGQVGVTSDAARGLGVANPRGTAAAPAAETPPHAARFVPWLSAGLTISDALQSLVGPAPVLVSDRAIGTSGDLAIRIYGQSYPGPEAGTAMFTRGVGGASLGVPATITSNGLSFDAGALERAYGKSLPAALGGTNGPQGEPERSNRPVPAPPVAGLDAVGERQRDDSCAPAGTTGEWVVVDRSGMSDAAEAYQRQIARTPDLPGRNVIEYRVTREDNGRSTMFDGCAGWSPERELLEAKFGGRSLHEAAQASRSEAFRTSVAGNDRNQAARQFGVVNSHHPVDWHVSDGAMLEPTRSAVNAGTGSAPNFTVQHTPARP